MIKPSQIIVNQILKGKTLLVRVDLNVPVINGLTGKPVVNFENIDFHYNQK